MSSEHFCDVLNQLVYPTLYSSGQLAQLTGIPKRTIANWLNGRVDSPRHWQDLVRLAAVLHLTPAETDRLLRTAAHDDLATLHRRAANPIERRLLSQWPVGAETPKSNRPERHRPRRSRSAPTGHHHSHRCPYCGREQRLQ